MNSHKKMKATRSNVALVLLASASLLPLTAFVRAETASPTTVPNSSTERPFSIPAGTLRSALIAFGEQAGLQIAFIPKTSNGVYSPGVNGKFTPQNALARLLAGTPLSYRLNRDGDVVLVEKSASLRDFSAQASAIELETVNVEGRTNPNSTMDAPATYAGGQVATGGRLGVLGNRSYMETPFSQTNYTEKLIRDQQAHTVQDVLDNTPAIRSVTPPFSVQDSFFARGFATNSRDFAFDGLFGIANRRRPALEGIERVEVLSGPSSLLFGFPPNGGIGVLVNLIPKRAADIPITRITTDYMSRAYGGISADIGRRFGQDNAIGIRLNGSYHGGGTPIDRQTMRSGVFTAGIDYRGDRFRISGDAGYQRLDYWGATFNFFASPGVVLPSAPSLTRNVHQPWETSKYQHVFGKIRAEYDLMPNITLFGAYGISRMREEYLYLSPTILDNAGTLRMSTVPYFAISVRQSAEVGLRGNFTTGPLKHAVSVSASGYFGYEELLSISGSAFTSNFYAPARIAEPDRSVIAVSPPPDGATELKSIGLADTISIVDDRVQLMMGLRLQSAKNVGYPTSAWGASFYKKNAMTPVVGLTIRPWRFLSTYVSYAEGFGFGASAPSDAANAGEMFPPTKSKQIEGGLKLDFGMIGGSLAIYQIDRPSSFTNPTTRIFSYDGRQRNRGVDLNVFGSPTENTRLLGGITFLDGAMTATQNGQYDGKQAVGVPHVQLNIGGEYDLPYFSGLTINGRVIYTSRQYYDQANTQSIPDWVRLDLGARYTFHVDAHEVTTRFNIINVAGNNYWSSTGNGSLSLGTPRTFMLSLSTSF